MMAKSLKAAAMLGLGVVCGVTPGQQAAKPRWQMPTVALLQNGASQTLPLEKTQLAETKTRSLASLSGDSAAIQGIQAGVSDATWNTATHINNGVGGSAVMQAGGIFNGILGSRQPTVTYVWGVPGPASANVLQTATPTFSVNFAKAPGVNPNEFAPEIVKLTPAQNTCRLVGATRGKEDARSHEAADWKIYSSFVEDRVAITLQKLRQANIKCRHGHHFCRANMLWCSGRFRRTRKFPAAM